MELPKALKIELNSPGATKVNLENILKDYNDQKAAADKLPPPGS
jgi:hypothetical protein